MWWCDSHKTTNNYQNKLKWKVALFIYMFWLNPLFVYKKVKTIIVLHIVLCKNQITCQK